MQEIANYIYLGMAFKESLILAGIADNELPSIVKDKGLLAVVDYARTKAKKDHLEAVHRIVNGEKASFATMQLLKHILSSRFGFTENRYELKQKEKQHAENLKHKQAALRQWAELQAIKIVQDAPQEQLEVWSKHS